MFICESCGQEFLNSDEFNAHIQKHFLDKLDSYSMLMSAFISHQGEAAEQATNEIANLIAQKVVGLMPPPPVSAVPVKVKRDYTFEAIQLTNIALSTKTSIETVLNTYIGFCDKLAERDKDHQ